MNRVLFETNVGNLLCSDISEVGERKRKLLSEEVVMDSETRSIFDEKENLTMQIWIADNKINFATRDRGFTRQTSVDKGLFSKFYKEIDKPAKSKGFFRLSILDERYIGSIISGPINEKDKKDFQNRIELIETQIIPKLMKLLNGEIVKERIGYNV